MFRLLTFAGLLLAGLGSSARAQALCPSGPTTLDVFSAALPCVTGYVGSGNVFTISQISGWVSKGAPLVGSVTPIQMSDITISIGANTQTAVYFDLNSAKFAVDTAHAASFGFVMWASGQYINSDMELLNSGGCSDLGLIVSSATFGSGIAPYAVNLENGIVYQKSVAVVNNTTGLQANTIRAAMVGFGCKLFAPTFRVHLSQ